MIGRLFNRISKTLQPPSLPVWLLEGTEKHGHEKFSVVYAGVERHKNYFSRIAFEGAPSEKALGNFRAKDLKAGTGLNHGQDLTVLEISEAHEKFFPAKGGEPRIPVWVWSACDLSGGRPAIEENNRYRTHRQRVRQHEVEYRVWKDEASLKDFYDNMYVPYASFRHAESTFTYSYEEAQKKFRSGQLSGLVKDGVPILSQVTALDGKNAHAFILGVRKGQEEYLKKGIMEAFNYLFLLQLAESGYTRLDLGYARGFLNDGVLRNKFRLGARLTGLIHKESGHLVYRVNKWSPAVRSFLGHNPAALSSDGKLWAGYFDTGADGAETAPPEKELKEDGFEGAKVLRFNERSKEFEISGS